MIQSEFLFKVYTVLKGKQNQLKAGIYDIWSDKNIPAILDIIVQGSTAKEKITIIEGWNLRNIGWDFENKGMFQAEEIFEVAGFPGVDYSESEDVPEPKDFSDEFTFLKEKPANISLEGYLFPDTYEIERNETVEQIIKRFLQNFDKKTKDLREEVEKQNKKFFDLLVMASLLEKEVISYEDKQIAAGILWKRLRNGWPLQVDACLTYLTGKGSADLTQEDLDIESPYNTYKYRGLPIGPIANPGLESIKAALYYKDSPYWFYLTTFEGETIFSKSLQEHAVNRAKYLK